METKEDNNLISNSMDDTAGQLQEAFDRVDESIKPVFVAVIKVFESLNSVGKKLGKFRIHFR
jgi:hypothetical protein